MTGYVKIYDENATMSFRATNKRLLKNNKKIWGKVEKLMRIAFESKPVYGDDDKYIKTKIKTYAGSFHKIFIIKTCQKKRHHASVYQ